MDNEIVIDDPIVASAERALAVSAFDQARYDVLGQFYICWEEFHANPCEETSSRMVSVAHMLRRMDA